MNVSKLVGCALLISACGGGVGDWAGTWKGSASVNTGRQPVVYTGTLTVSDAALFTVSSDAQGMPSQSFTCGVTATSVDSTTAKFSLPRSCTLTATPGDDCTYAVTLNTITATRNGTSITAHIAGQLQTTCTVQSRISESFALDSANVTRQ
jgi:hypothetical protein